jgi:hypothetical protein
MGSSGAERRRQPAGLASKPSWYVVATADKMIPPDAQRAMATRAGSTVREVVGSHAVYVSQPGAVANVIEQAAAALSQTAKEGPATSEMMLASETGVHQTLVSVSRSVTRVSDGGAVPMVPARVCTSRQRFSACRQKGLAGRLPTVIR